MTVPDPAVDDPDDPSYGIFGRTDYEASRPSKRDFKPWHLPRKQFVRSEQWVDQALKVFEGRCDDQPVRYLGLPGVDLLDLRYFHGKVCGPLSRSLRYLGFNSEAGSGDAAEVDLNTSLDEVARLGEVDPQSLVVRDDFRSLAREDSIAWQRAKGLGPFDVVNLDFCDGIASGDPGANGSLYQAMGKLLALQVRSQHPWLLLVTTRIGRDHFDADALARLLGHLRSNLGSCESFVDACRELFGANEPASVDASTCSADVFLKMLLLSLCKWLLMLGQASSPNRVELASSQGYRVNGGADCIDLISFALVFKAVMAAPADALGAGPAQGIDECAEATRIAGRVRSLKDVDEILDGDGDLAERLASQTELLLKSARYDTSSYRSWLAMVPGE